ncbi:retrovirus-related pol polyprotein from transposon TNT 1-94 [Tanacetum coccineum]
MSVNALYQPWRAILSMINMCLTSKTVGYDRSRHSVLQILWGIIHRSNIDYDERIWEEFVQSVQTFLTDRKNLTTASRRKKKTAHLLIPSIRFTKLIIHHLKTKHNIHPRIGLPLHYSHEENVLNTLRFIGKDGREIFEHGQAEEGGATQSPKATKETPDDPLLAKRLKAGLVGKRRKARSPLKLVDEPSDEGVPVKKHVYNKEEANLQRALELSLKDKGERTQGPARPVVLREPVSGKFQPLPERRTHMPTEPSGHVESPSLDAELALTDSETESDKEVSEINAGNQDEGQAGSNPGDAAESQPQSSHVVHAGPNLEHMDLEATDASTQQNPEQMIEEFIITAYPNV